MQQTQNKQSQHQSQHTSPPGAERHNDDSVAAESAERSKPANNEERHGQQAADKGTEPSGHTGVFGSHAPFGKPEAIDSQIAQSDTRSERH